MFIKDYNYYYEWLKINGIKTNINPLLLKGEPLKIKLSVILFRIINKLKFYKLNCLLKYIVEVIIMKNNKHTFVVLAYKESKFLEECIKSVRNQSVKGNVIIATSTPNDYINKLAKKYKLKIKVNEGKKGIGYDFDFAVNAADTELVTVAHQDDIYDYDYAKEVISAYKNQKKSIIIFPDYYEIRK